MTAQKGFLREEPVLLKDEADFVEDVPRTIANLRNEDGADKNT